MIRAQAVWTDDRGMVFYGKVETTTRDVWWYTDGTGKQHTVLPSNIMLLEEKVDG
jgi:hypothetical protein